MHNIAAIATGLLGIAMVTTLVAHPDTSNVINSVGNAFSGAMRAAMGK